MIGTCVNYATAGYFLALTVRKLIAPDCCT